MDIVISFSVRRDGRRALIVEDLIVRDVLVKDEEEVLRDVSEQLPDIIDRVYEEIESENNTYR